MKHWGPRVAGAAVILLLGVAGYQAFTEIMRVRDAIDVQMHGQIPNAYTLEHLANHLAAGGMDVQFQDVSGEVKLHEQMYRIRIAFPATILGFVPVRLSAGYRSPIETHTLETLDLSGMEARGWKITGVTPSLNLR